MRTLQSVASLPNLTVFEATTESFSGTGTVNDNNILFPIRKGESWLVRLNICCTYDAGTGIRFQWTGPTAKQFGFSARMVEPSKNCTSGTITLLGSTLILTGSGSTIATIEGAGALLGATADGTLQLQIGQGKATAGALQVQQDSWAVATRISSLAYGATG